MKTENGIKSDGVTWEATYDERGNRLTYKEW